VRLEGTGGTPGSIAAHLRACEESGRMPVVLHINNLKQMYGKWLASEQNKWWVAAAGILLMDQPDAVLKFIEARPPFVSMSAGQEAIAAVRAMVDAAAATSGRSSRRRKRSTQARQW
jgi:hypothetical protein